MSIALFAIQRVKKYLAARRSEPFYAKQNSIHGFHITESTSLNASDVQALVDELEKPGRVLKKREDDILKVYPIIWDNMFGGLLYAVDQASGILRSQPDQAQHILEGLRQDLVNLRDFMMEGDPVVDTITIGSGEYWFEFKKKDGGRVIVQGPNRVEAKLAYRDKYPNDPYEIKDEGEGKFTTK